MRLETVSNIVMTAVGVVLIDVGWDAEGGGWLSQLALIFGGFFLGHVVTEVLNEGEVK